LAYAAKAKVHLRCKPLLVTTVVVVVGCWPGPLVEAVPTTYYYYNRGKRAKGQKFLSDANATGVVILLI
jgi:hypothetical protein